MRVTSKLLRKNISTARMAGFALSNFIGLLIVAGAVMFYLDGRNVFGDEESVVNTDYLVINKKVTSASTLGNRESTRFSPDEISDLKSQPWVRDAGEFTASDFHVYASVSTGGRGLETALFFEAVPDAFLDNAGAGWSFKEGDTSVPIIISKDYLALYNFGFAGSAGLPQLSEQLISGIPLELYMRSDDGSRSLRMKGRIAGFSDRINSVLVPQDFMTYANSRLGSGAPEDPSRLIIDVSSPGDVDIQKYLDTNSLEVAGDKSKSGAAFILRVVAGTVMTVGIIITILSLAVLMLSMSLLMEKNRTTIHSLLMLGSPLRKVAAPYWRVIAGACAAAWLLAAAALIGLHALYATALEGFGASGHGLTWAIATGTILASAIALINVCAVNHKIKAAWALRRE